MVGLVSVIKFTISDAQLARSISVRMWSLISSFAYSKLNTRHKETALVSRMLSGFV